MSSSPRHHARDLRRSSLRGQVPWLLLACVVGLGLASLAPLATLASEGRIPVMDLMADPAEVTGIPWYIGAVSDLNLFVWAAGAALLFLAAFGLRRTDRRLSGAMAWLALLTVVLTLDDRFLLHEIVFPWLFGMPEIVTYGIYAAVTVLILLRYGRILLRQPEIIIFLLALLGLGTSVGLDVFGWDSTLRRAAEETAKLLGTAAWAVFPAAIISRHLSAAAEVRPAPADAASSPDSITGRDRR